MNGLIRIFSIIFGVIFFSLSFAVSLETLTRRLFNISLGGIDELSGYAVAVAAGLAFSVTLIQRAHIRIDIITSRLSATTQARLNWLASVSMAVLGVFCIWLAYGVIGDTIAYGSRAPTVWATPLVYPQAPWFLALLTFCLLSVFFAVRATRLLLRRDTEALNRDFGPRGAKEELQEELEDIRHRDEEVVTP
ncbi:TRAP transporter small permease [Halomonas campisalis]|uniref:TRAP transporter small permease protein n=1 Tax=Billgrantia campisalis TaxID=74661 RepID=A0ABS9PBN5_9GAMM|nr:TRAP transporter small permease [Halomonas campisalis]MCG6659169.1 TRAP transporter small permease [Halomonas campisalis]MDR5863795.1 TRAP transporter small permease [Halomonas campisalis]